MCDLVQHRVGIDGCKMVVDPFAFIDIPFQEAYEGAAATQVGASADRAMRTSSLVTASAS
jgi:hypothetical protein